MKLGGKSKDVDSFVDQLKSEGEHVSSGENAKFMSNKSITKSVASQPQVNIERYVNSIGFGCLFYP